MFSLTADQAFFDKLREEDCAHVPDDAGFDSQSCLADAPATLVLNSPPPSLGTRNLPVSPACRDSPHPEARETGTPISTHVESAAPSASIPDEDAEDVLPSPGASRESTPAPDLSVVEASTQSKTLTLAEELHIAAGSTSPTISPARPCVMVADPSTSCTVSIDEPPPPPSLGETATCTNNPNAAAQSKPKGKVSKRRVREERAEVSATAAKRQKTGPEPPRR